MKDKSGKKVSLKEALQRWKEGVKNITPLQQLKMQITSTWITIIGIIAGLVMAYIYRKTFWWGIIILVGALGTTISGLIGAYQKYSVLKQIQKQMEMSVDTSGGKDGL